MRFDLSVGQRVLGGFALVLLLFGGAFIAMSRSHDAIGLAERDLVQNIAPLRHKAVELERAVFQLGIDTRAFLISPDDLNADTQRIAVDRLMTIARDLRVIAKDDAGEALYRNCLPLLEAYVAAADRAMQQRRRGTLGLRPERALGDARENAISAIRAFSDYHETRSSAALNKMAEERDRAALEVQVALALTLALFVCIALVTVQSIRRPVRELVEFARDFGAGPRASMPGRMSRLTALAGGKEPPRDEMAQLERLLAAAAATLDERSDRLRARARLAAAAACSLAKTEVADASLMVIAEHVRADAGVVYWRVGELLTPIATYAMEKAAPVRVGEDIAGRAAQSGRAIVSDDNDRDPLLDVKLGYSDARSKTLIAVPLASRGDVLGVLVAVSVAEFDESQRAFLESSAGLLALGLRHALAYERLQHLAREAGSDVDPEEWSCDGTREATTVPVAAESTEAQDLQAGAGDDPIRTNPADRDRTVRAAAPPPRDVA